MNIPPKIDQHLADYFAGTITPEAMQQLEDWLRLDPAHIDLLAGYGLIEQGLVVIGQESTATDIFEALAEVESPTIVELTEDDLIDADASDGSSAMAFVIDQALAERRKHELEDEANRQLAAQLAEEARNRRYELRRHTEPEPVKRVVVIPKVAAWLGLAAAIGLAMWIGWSKAPATSISPSPVVESQDESAPALLATLIDTFRPQWDAQLRPGRDGLTAGRYRLVEGQARLRLADGTEVKLVAPVEFELAVPGEMDLYDGVLVADVPQQASGFCVHTPAGDVVDIGTTFGVEVIDDTTTEAEVVDGLIRVAAKTAEGGLTAFVDVEDAEAARLDCVAGRVEPIQAGGDRFSMDYVNVIDLVDAVAGGDGTTGRRNAGIDPQTGDWQDVPFGESMGWTRVGDQQFHAVRRCPLVAGTFIPTGDGVSTQLDPAGNTFNRFTVTHSLGYGQSWAGGFVPVPGSQPELDTIIDGVNYAAPSRGLVRMHANSGLCFDLAEMRRRNPGLTTARFRTGLSNREATRREASNPVVDTYASVDIWVFVDGDLRYTERDVTTDDGLIDIDLPLTGNDQYLTVVITDGLNDTLFDWVLLCQPRIDLTPDDLNPRNRD